MTMRYEIPAIPPSNNRFIGRDNRWEYAKLKREWEQRIAVLCRPKPHAPITRARVTIRYDFPDRRRRDPDNYSGKMILDGLVKAGIIEDDSFRQIELRLSARFGCKQALTMIVIEECEKRT